MSVKHISQEEWLAHVTDTEPKIEAKTSVWLHIEHYVLRERFEVK